MSSIYLSPSTQENNIGFGAYGTEEKRMNLLGDIVEEKLCALGHTIYRNEPSMSVQKIAVDSNLKKPDFHIALHSNAGANTVQGAEIFCHKFGGQGEKLARQIYKYIEAITPSSDRGVKEGYKAINGSPMYELANTTAPAVLLEVAFHSNPVDAKWMIENMDLIATSIVKGIQDYIGKPVSVPTVSEKNYKKMYFDLVEDLEKVMMAYGGVR